MIDARYLGPRSSGIGRYCVELVRAMQARDPELGVSRVTRHAADADVIRHERVLGAAANNWTRVVHLEARLATNVRMMRTVGTGRARAKSAAFVQRFGGLVGNVSLGLMLGVVPAAFAILRLPIDIRHLTVSSAAFALALGSHGGSPREIWLAAAGVAPMLAWRCNAARPPDRSRACDDVPRGSFMQDRACAALAPRDAHR